MRYNSTQDVLLHRVGVARLIGHVRDQFNNGHVAAISSTEYVLEYVLNPLSLHSEKIGTAVPIGGRGERAPEVSLLP